MVWLSLELGIYGPLRESGIWWGVGELKRYYAYFHRVLLELLADSVEEGETHWLSNKQGHIPRLAGEANSYRKALYVLEDLEPYRKRLRELETIQQTATVSGP